MSFLLYAMYYGPTLIVEDIGFDIFISGILMQCSEIIIYPPTYKYIEEIPRKKTGMWRGDIWMGTGSGVSKQIALFPSEM